VDIGGKVAFCRVKCEILQIIMIADEILGNFAKVLQFMGFFATMSNGMFLVLRKAVTEKRSA